jgi:hypothetical protein
MGKRGCPTDDYSTLDLDLKARFLTTEEIMYALSTKMSVALESYKIACPPWWDRSCDLGLLIGTFFHGLGNYDAMRNDEDLPFSNKIKSYVMSNRSEAEPYRHFELAADAAKNVFDTALVSMKRKFQEQTHAAVAAVFAASKNVGANDAKPEYLAKTQEMDDDDIVSLPRLKAATMKAFRESFDVCSKAGKNTPSNFSLPLPDSKYLDYLLVQIVRNIESNSSFDQSESFKQEIVYNSTEDSPDDQQKISAISTNREVFLKANLSTAYTSRNISGQTQLLFQRSHFGADKKPQDDGSDYFLGAASQELASIAVGADSSRYQRGLHVPLIVTRYALGAILHAEEYIIECLVKNHSNSSTDTGNSDHHQPNFTLTVTENGEVSDENTMIIGVAHDEGKAKPREMVTANSFPTWKYIQDNTTLRASICIAMLRGEYTLSRPNEKFVNISEELWQEINRRPPFQLSCQSTPTGMATRTFLSVKNTFLPLFNSAGVDWPDDDASLHEYIESVLLPHCIKLCLALAEEQTKIACDQGKSDVYLGRPPYKKLCPLPDPFIPFEYHSEEAISHAYAILRRIKLMKSIRFIVGGGVSLKTLMKFLRGPLWLGQAMGIPVW